MKRKPQFVLGTTERIVACVPTFTSGPGWSNAPLWVYIYDNATKTCREECLQPDEQTTAMRHLFVICAHAHAEMLGEVLRNNVKRAKQ